MRHPDRNHKSRNDAICLCFIQPIWNLVSYFATVLLRWVPSDKEIQTFMHRILWLQDFAKSWNTTSCRELAHGLWKYKHNQVRKTVSSYITQHLHLCIFVYTLKFRINKARQDNTAWSGVKKIYHGLKNTVFIRWHNHKLAREVRIST